MLNPDAKRNNLRKPDARLEGLRILFKEVLQYCPPEDAQKLEQGYWKGKTIILAMGLNSYDAVNNTTAFRFQLTNDQSWRGLPPANGGIQ